MHAAVPPVEIPDNADALAVGSPDGEMRAFDGADPHDVRAELVVDSRVLAFAEQIQVVVGDDPAVPVRIVDFVGIAAWIEDTEPVVERFLHAGEAGFENAGRMHAGHLDRLVAPGNEHPFRSRMERTDHERAVLAMRTEKGERIGMARARQGVEPALDDWVHRAGSGITVAIQAGRAASEGRSPGP